MDLLLLLVERRGRLVPRSEILDRLWGKDVFVDVETGVHTAIRKIRRALRDSPDAPASDSALDEPPPAQANTLTAGAASFRIDRAIPATASQPAASATAETPVEPRVAAPAATAARMRLTLGLVVAALLIGVGVWSLLPDGAPPRSSPLTLAVLPFTNLNGDPTREYIARASRRTRPRRWARSIPNRWGLSLAARLCAIRARRSPRARSDESWPPATSSRAPSGSRTTGCA